MQYSTLDPSTPDSLSNPRDLAMFDLFDFQEKVRDCFDPRKLYDMIEELCRLKQRGIIGTYEYDELAPVIRQKIRTIETVRSELKRNE